MEEFPGPTMDELASVEFSRLSSLQASMSTHWGDSRTMLTLHGCSTGLCLALNASWMDIQYHFISEGAPDACQGHDDMPVGHV